MTGWKSKKNSKTGKVNHFKVKNQSYYSESSKSTQNLSFDLDNSNKARSYAENTLILFSLENDPNKRQALMRAIMSASNKAKGSGNSEISSIYRNTWEQMKTLESTGGKRQRVTLQQVPYGGDPYVDVDSEIKDTVRKINNDLHFSTYASCEGHPKEEKDLTTQAYVASKIFNLSQLKKIEEVIKTNNFKPMSRIGFLKKAGKDYISDLDHRPKSDVYYYADVYQKEYPKYYMTFEIKREKFTFDGQLRPENFIVRITPKENVAFIPELINHQFINRKSNVDMRGEQKYTGKNITQSKWDKVRKEGFDEFFKIFQVKEGGKYSYSAKPRNLFIIDENLPPSVVNELRRRGYNAKHVTQIFRRGVPDETIKNYAEQNHAIVLTRDTISFPEPRGSGDRVIIKDVPRERTVDEVLSRMKELGW